ncbi:hypothetical protein AVEN_236209-1 [Araneus ventricosus]|uniref:DUF4371 domain-containing protein n=1 Tax=Araneus ventricosus TaxID=182803 RepID=A0A4Y2CCE1_ARAVE|nr:hypothetical protein AVEN_236209-1 [Araneus ventricosus]
MREALRASPILGTKGCSFSARGDFAARYTPSCALTLDSPTSALATCDRELRSLLKCQNGSVNSPRITESILCFEEAPLAQEELKEDLTKSNYVSVSMDASNRKDIKLEPIVVCYFNPNSGVQVKLLDFKSVAGETSEILTNRLCCVLLQNDLNNKVVGFCGDNCNTNFGGVKRAGQKNIFHRLKNSLGREINGIGCGANIVHNCMQTAVDSLPIDIEALLVGDL